MKPRRDTFRIWVLSSALLIGFQSCTVYHKVPASLSQAAEEHTRSRVIAGDGSVVRYRYIVEDDGTYFGIRRYAGKLRKVQLAETGTEVYLKNRKATKRLVWGLAGATVLGPLVYAGLVSLAFSSYEFEWPE